MEWLESGEVVLEESVIQSLWAGCGLLTRYITNRRRIVVKQVNIRKLQADTSFGTLRKLKLVHMPFPHGMCLLYLLLAWQASFIVCVIYIVIFACDAFEGARIMPYIVHCACVYHSLPVPRTALNFPHPLFSSILYLHSQKLPG